ncbi:MAG: hypothetical protein ABSA39_05920 [Edaphobacter sp.]
MEWRLYPCSEGAAIKVLRCSRPLSDGSDPLAVFLLCVSGEADVAKKGRLNQISWQIQAARQSYDNYASVSSLYVLSQATSVGGLVTTEEMKSLYKKATSSAKGSARSIYNQLLNATPNSICPLCGQGRVGALDHYLPQSAYPEYVVLPSNLVPACTDCNQAKRAWFAKSADDQILHPYFDNFSDDQWLHAKVIPGQSPALRFYAAGPAHWSPVDRARVESHFKVFKLARLFTTHAGSELGSIRSHLVHELKGDEDRIKDHLLEQANSRRAAFLNSWQTAMYVRMSTTKLNHIFTKNSSSKIRCSDIPPPHCPGAA